MNNTNFLFSSSGVPNLQAGFGSSLRTTALNPAHHSSSPFPISPTSSISEMHNNNKENMCGNYVGLGHVLYSNKELLAAPSFMTRKSHQVTAPVCTIMSTQQFPQSNFPSNAESLNVVPVQQLPFSKNSQSFNLMQYFEEASTFEKGLSNLRNHKGDFTFTFDAELENLSRDPLKLQQDLEICRKVQYEILRKLKYFNMFQQRGMLCVQNTTAALDKEKYWFAHHEKPRKIVKTRIANRKNVQFGKRFRNLM